MTPALFQRTSRRSSFPRNSFADFLIVVKSFRSKCRNSSCPLEFGNNDLMRSIALPAFASERVAT